MKICGYVMARVLPVVAGLLLSAAGVAGRAAADELRLDARTLMDRSVTSSVRLSADGAAVELESGVLFEDDGPAAGFSYKPNEEKLSESVWIKKEFNLPDPRARKATLLVGPGGKLKALINGKPCALGAPAKTGGHWQAYAIPPELLRPGKNEVVLSGAGKVWIARDEDFAAGSRTVRRHPNRSAKSSDAGKTWDDERLGAAGDCDGEYCVRLFLEQHPQRGELILPVLDVGNLGGALVAPPLAAVGPVRIRLDRDATGSVAVYFRHSTLPFNGDAARSAWYTLAPTGVIDKPAGRYLELKLHLATTDPLKTPRLEAITVSADPKPSSDWIKKLRVVKSHNEEIVRSSIPFQYEPYDHPKLKLLRERYKLDEVVKGADSELDLISRLAAWSSSRFERSHLRDSYPPWDALEILKPHADGTPVGGFCQQYNIVFLQACASFGIPGRAVSLGAGDHGVAIRSGHEVVEIWSNQHKKWIYIDGQMAWMLVDAKTSVPLSLLELRDRQLADFRGKPAAAVRAVALAEHAKEWKGFGGFPPFAELRLIPRSNFLQERVPLPLNQGMRGWFWTGHHVFTDEAYPAALLYGHRVTSRRNWEWTLNQVHWRLEATDTPGELRVHLDSETPGLQSLLAARDDLKEAEVTPTFPWRLNDGRNRLVVWPRNQAGRSGISSSVEVLLER